MYGYEPTYGLDRNQQSPGPTSDECIAQMKRDREDVVAALTIATKQMKDYKDRQVRSAQFKVRDQVWLDAKNLQQLQPSWKLSHRRLGPYKVKRVLGELNYELDLPPSMKIHPLFYVGLLQPAPLTNIPGRQFPQPPPVLIQEQEEYEVESILDSRIYRGNLQYLIKWKGYSHADNTWEPSVNVANSPDLVTRFHQQHPTAPRTNRSTRGRRSGGG